MEQQFEITQVTRRNIADWISVENLPWSGRLDEVAFLKRLFDVESLPSTDHRYKTASGDIWKHRVANEDWDNGWVFDDSRFDLMNGPADTFLRFLCEMLHPVVRLHADDVEKYRVAINGHLRPDGVELIAASQISGRPVFAARSLSARNSTVVVGVKSVSNVLNADYVHQQTDRLLVALDEDPELAIGTAKEFVETICKTILEDKGLAADSSWEFPKLVRSTMRELKLVPDSVESTSRGADTIRQLLMNLASIANAMAEVRNLYGTGHGKAAKTKGLQTRHARLAVGAASTLAVFLFETHQDQKKS